MDKKELRAEIRRRKKEHSAEELGSMSAEVMNTLEDSDFFLKAKYPVSKKRKRRRRDEFRAASAPTA